jgi:hypothetical protein
MANYGRDLKTRRIEAADSDRVQLEVPMGTEFESGSPPAQGRELSKPNLKAAERPQPDDQGPLERGLTRSLVQFLIRLYAP